MPGSVRNDNRPTPPPSEMDNETPSSSGDGARTGRRLAFATPSFSPREAMALRKHVIGTREKKRNGGIGDDVGVVRRERGGIRNGSSIPAPPRQFEMMTTPSPREARAYEKHLVLRGARERSNDNRGGLTPLTKTGGASPLDVRSIGKAESAYDRHVRRIQGRPSTA